MIYSLKDFVTVPCYIINDENLSYSAKGLYAVIAYLSQESDSLKGTILMEDVKKTFGEKGVTSSLAELVEIEYVKLKNAEVTI